MASANVSCLNLVSELKMPLCCTVRSLKSVYIHDQRGAVCQWSLLCVKQVRPGRLQSSPFLCRFFSFLSFFLLRISLYNCVFPSISCAASLSGRNVRELQNGAMQRWHQPLPSPTPVTTAVEDLEGDFQKALPMPGYDSLFTFMYKLSLCPIFSGMTF